MNRVPKACFDFLKALKDNNNKDWMDANRAQYKRNELALKAFYQDITDGLNRNDVIARTKVFRINRDIRFSKDKTPYNVHRSVSFSREGAHRRGGYYLRIEPGASAVAGGFWNPEPADLLRIRKEFEFDAEPIRKILAESRFKEVFDGFNTDHQVKTAPKGFNRNDPNIDLIKNKTFVVVHSFTDQEGLAPDFGVHVLYCFEILRPYFDYMSEVLTTDLNGVSLL